MSRVWVRILVYIYYLCGYNLDVVRDSFNLFSVVFFIVFVLVLGWFFLFVDG